MDEEDDPRRLLVPGDEDEVAAFLDELGKGPAPGLEAVVGIGRGRLVEGGGGLVYGGGMLV